MRPILIAITRQNRAERPSEATLEYIYQQTAVAALSGTLGSPEDHVTDTFIKTYPRRSGDSGISLEIERVMQNRYAPIHPKEDDGVCVYEYEYNGGSGRTELKSETIPSSGLEGEEDIVINETVDLRVVKENGVTEVTSYTSLVDARNYIDTLHGSDGYVMIGQFKGKSEVLETRPCLWDLEERVLPLLQLNRYPDRQNENDRH